jgi:hypothetical protein
MPYRVLEVSRLSKDLRARRSQGFLCAHDFIHDNRHSTGSGVLTHDPGDEAVAPDYQSMMVRTGGFGSVVRIPAGHAPMRSMPGRVVRILEEVVSTAC